MNRIPNTHRTFGMNRGENLGERVASKGRHHEGASCSQYLRLKSVLCTTENEMDVQILCRDGNDSLTGHLAIDKSWHHRHTDE